MDRARARERGVVAALGGAPVGELRYPLAPLRCEPRAPRLNVLLVVIDAMRADALTAAVAPRLAEFARGAIQFDQHYSGGNSSRAGMFSLFYGLPATYWDAFADLARPPVVMDLFRQYGYQLGLFVSSPLVRRGGARSDGLGPRARSAPEDELAISGVERERPGADRRVVRLARPAGPGAAVLRIPLLQRRGGGRPAGQLPPGGPGRPRRVDAATPVRRYLSAVHYVDSLVGRVLDDLERRKLLESTVVLVTSDHGMEFDENGQGFTGHGTAYSDYQMHTPLVLRWPGRPPGRVAAADLAQRRGADPGRRALRLRESGRRTTRAVGISSRTGSGTGSSRRATASSP